MESNRKWGYIDKTRKLVIPCKWDEAKVFKNGVAIVEYDDSILCFIDKLILSPLTDIT